MLKSRQNKISEKKRKEIEEIVYSLFDDDNMFYSVEDGIISIFITTNRDIIVGMYDLTLKFWAYINERYTKG